MAVVRLVALIAIALISPRAWAADFVWIEGENPTDRVPSLASEDWKHPFLSGGNWLHIGMDAGRAAKDAPADGVLIGYAFSAPAGGRYEVWNRIGYASSRTPFAWRIDGGAWRTVGSDEPVTDLVELALWSDLGWLRMGEAELSGGAHRLEIRLLQSVREENGRPTAQGINYASDALCLSAAPFRPNMKWKPGDDWRTEDDRKAAAQVFEMKGAPAGERSEASLGGLWQVCRYDETEIIDRTGPTKTLPDGATAFWTSIAVPGDKFALRKDLAFCHRFVYRTRVNVPVQLAGRSFVLRLPSQCLIASVIVNGRFCGWTKAPFAAFECDVTPAIRPGEANEICVVVKDAYYGFSEKRTGKSAIASFNLPSEWIGSKNWLWQNLDFPVGSGYAAQSGLIQLPPALVAAGSVYASDIFVLPSVKRRALEVRITLANPSETPRRVQVACEVVPRGGGRAAKSFAPMEVTLAPGEERLVTLNEPWANPTLWWPDRPQLYEAVVRLAVDGAPADTSRAVFGFREWDWSTPQFRLNGVPWQLWADTTNLDGGSNADTTLAGWRRAGQNVWRFWGQTFAGMYAPDALNYMDAHGMIVRRSGIFDGQGANYLGGLTNNRELYDNWIVQQKAQVKAERNHPSVLIWSLENEVTFINSRNLGQIAAAEPEIERGAKEILAFDPTRPVMVDGGNALANCSLPVNGGHYLEMPWREYPDEAYTMRLALKAHAEPVDPTWGKSPWRLMPDRPTFLGESYFLRGNKPGEFALFGGEGCFSGWGADTRRGAGLYAKMLAEGYRWAGVAAHHFWLGAADAGSLHFNSWQPVCVLCRQWNWTFGGGRRVERLLKVFNDTRFETPITAAWELTVGGRRVASGAQVFALKPGEHREWPVAFTTPRVATRTAARLALSCSRDGKELFRETKAVTLIDPDAAPRPAYRPGEVVVLDPEGAARRRLTARRIPFTSAASLAAIPARARLVIVGSNALSARDATDPRWTALAGAGARLIVLEQRNPLRFQAVPADLTPAGATGRIAFAENLNHPVFAGLDQPDLFTWSKDHIVYRNAYAKATRGAVSLAQCDQELGLTALSECPVNDGLMLLCQMVVGEKLGTDPVAQRLFDNMVAYCASYAPIRRRTAVVMDPASPRGKLLSESGLKFDRMTDALSAVSAGKHDVIVFDATPAALRTLAGAAARVRAFAGRGGWLIAWGVTPAGLADFNRLVGVQHLIRPFELERVQLPALRDPLIAGLTNRDVAMESSIQIFPWAGDKFMSRDEFTHIVDFDDVAPFCEIPGARAGDPSATDRRADWPRNIVNGFTSADGWVLIHYLGRGTPSMTLTLPRPEVITDFSIVLNMHYCKPSKVNLYFDADPNPVTMPTRLVSERQDFALPAPRRASKLRIELAAFDVEGPTTGIDNVWIWVRRPSDFAARVRPLLNIGGLVKYPMGPGGVLLNQLNVPATESVPANAQKKRTIVAALLRNLHATFAGGRVLTAANLTYQPIPLDSQCNQFLGKDRGWFQGDRDLTHLPTGQNTLGGVRYLVRDFRTSPVPACVMLGGQGARGSLPDRVEGLRVEAAADVLFFLHTFNRVAEWRRGRPEDAAPIIFRYVIHYADGQTAEAPVLYGEGADHWISAQPAGLKGASVAWAAPFPPGASTGAPEQAVVYQFAWQNPRPGVAIRSIDVAYGPDGARWGQPALLAITAGRAK